MKCYCQTPYKEHLAYINSDLSNFKLVREVNNNRLLNTPVTYESIELRHWNTLINGHKNTITDSPLITIELKID